MSAPPTGTSASAVEGERATTIGRFRIVRTLGRGAQGRVDLASDPELGRLVAIKTLILGGDCSAVRVERLLQEARTASALSHPNIVPVYEVGMHQCMPYVVFEYVEGRTLGQVLRADGPMQQARAVVTMSQILAGMAHAHSKGVVHGDITPSNILLATTGLPRVTDFGISRDLRTRNPVPIGTPGYMAPEHFNGGEPDLRADVFALGLIFWEMLVGEPAIGTGDDFGAIYRTLSRAIAKPSQQRSDLDPRLDDVVCRALDKDPEVRFNDAGEMKEALDRFRIPGHNLAPGELAEASTHSTVEFLLRRMRNKADFPAFSQRFADINRLTAENSATPVHQLAKVVLQDFALTQKLLKVVNSVAYGGGGRVVTVSQAILKLGLEQVRVIATGLMLATPPHGRSMHPGLPEVLLGAFVAAVLGRNLGRMAGLKDAEELFICSMFGRLGEILAIYYFAEDYDAIVRMARERGVRESAAASEVLGLGFDELGIEVARRWNFPPQVLHAMRELPEGDLPAATTERERIAQCSGFARELCDAAWRAPPTGHAELAIALIGRFRATIPTIETHLGDLIGRSLDVAGTYCAIVGSSTTNSALIDGLSRWAAQSGIPHEERSSASAPRAVSNSSAAQRPPATSATRDPRKMRSWYSRLLGER